MQKVLQLLKDADGYLSGEYIAHKLNVSRAAVWKRICRLRKEGFSIEAMPRTGYRLVDCPDRMLPVEIKDGLKTSFVGQEIAYYPKVESTNLIAKKMALEGAKEGTIVITEKQTKGRGRLDRKWLSPSYKNILMSIIYRPKIQPAHVFSLTMLTSLAIVKGIKKTMALDALIKWPNDIYFGKKKTGGILTEFHGNQDSIDYVIVGVGLNVNFDPSLYDMIREDATSVSNELGTNVSRVILLRSILEEIEKGCLALNNGDLSKIHKEWLTYSLVTGKRVKIISLDSIDEGIAESIDQDGCLILRCAKNKRKKIISGDVSLRF